MIGNLNQLTFRSFGEIEPHYCAAALKTIPVTASMERFWRMSGEEVVLERQAGMPVLQVWDGKTEKSHSFYLDKPVKLNPGLWFRLWYLEGEGTATILCSPGCLAEIGAYVGADDAETQTPLRVTKIYTLFYQEQGPEFFFAGEKHRPYELVYVDQGALHSVAGGRDTLLRQGELTIYPPDRWHMQYAEPGGPVCFVSIAFDLDCPCPDALADRRFAPSHLVRGLVDQMLREQEKEDYFFGDMLLCKLQELVVLLLRQTKEATPAAPLETPAAIKRENDIVRQAQQYTAENLDVRLTVQELSFAVSVSASYLSALFRKHLGIPPSRYISRARLARAKGLLREGNLTVTEVAHMLGYSTIQHFSRCFRAEFHVSPTQYARSLAKRPTAMEQ